MTGLTAAAATRERVGHVEVGYLDGEAYQIRVRGHRVRVDQPVDAHGADSAPTPTELFVASLGTCVASPTSTR
jgi:putative redox protein